jgi:hypothetical protein
MDIVLVQLYIAISRVLATSTNCQQQLLSQLLHHDHDASAPPQRHPSPPPSGKTQTCPSACQLASQENQQMSLEEAGWALTDVYYISRLCSVTEQR